MIAKKVRRNRTQDSFSQLAKYITGEKVEAVSSKIAANEGAWQRTASYVLDQRLGGRVGAVRVSNCVSTDPEDAIIEIQGVQARNKRARSEKSYHLVVSFPPGEKPTPEQLRDIEDELCAAIGFKDHQRISAVHTDTDHLHIHIAISKVNPATFRCVSPSHDMRKLMKACDRLEIKHGLTRINHGQEQGESMRGRGADMEAHSGQEALMSWISKNALAEIQACLRGGGGWQEMHKVLAAYDLTIQPRGAGLVVATSDGKTMVRASRLSRALSMAKLAKRWGAYQPVAGARPPAKARYQRAPKRQGPKSAKLWADYQEARKAAAAARELAFERITADQANRWAALETWKTMRRKANREVVHLTREGREEEWAKYRRELLVRVAEIQGSRDNAKAKAKQDNPLPTWFGWLQEKAGAGDVEALAVLRDRDEKRQVAAAAFAAATDEAQAKTVVFSQLAPTVRKDGKAVYLVRDGGKVVNGADNTQVEVVTPHALFLTLSLLADSGGGPVKLSGEAWAIEEMIGMAVAKKMNVTFADPAHERRRLELSGQPLPPPQQPQPSAGWLARLRGRRP